MEIKSRLNIDIGNSLTKLRHIIKEFEVRKKPYKIFYRGKSFDFDGYKDYTSDEDISSIDWKASIRANRLIVRQYKEEEDLKLIFIIDVSDQMVFGSTVKLKCEYSAEVVLSLANIMIRAGDRVGFIIFSDKVNYFSIPKRGIKQFNFLTNYLSDYKIYKGRSNINNALEFVIKNFDISFSAVILVSDFFSINKETNNLLNLVSNRYETIALMIKDPVEKSLPDLNGEFIIEDPNSGEQLLVEPKLAKKLYDEYSSQKEINIEELFKNSGVDFLKLYTDKNFVADLSIFLKGRVRKKINI